MFGLILSGRGCDEMPDEPSRRTRIGLLAAAGGLLVAGATTAAVTAAVSPGHSHQYRTLPAACSLVKPATMSKYLPGATGSSFAVPAAGDQAGGCAWYTADGGQSQALSVIAEIGQNPLGDFLQQEPSYTLAQSNAQAYKVTTVDRAVPGLGDRADAMFLTVSRAGSRSVPDYQLLLQVWSGNATIFASLNFSGTPAAAVRASPADAVRQDGLIAMAQDALAALANPAAVPPPPASPSAGATAATPVPAPSPTPQPGPHYASPAAPCKLVSAATLAKYLPGASVLDSQPAPAATGSPVLEASHCGWDGDAQVNLTVFVTVFQYAVGPASAQEDFQFSTHYDAQSRTYNGTRDTVNGSRQVTGLGSQAAAFFETETSSQLGTEQLIQLLMLSGNTRVDIDLSYGDNQQLPGAMVPGHSEELTAATAIARDILAALPRKS